MIDDLKSAEERNGAALQAVLSYVRGLDGRERAILADRVVSGRETLGELGTRFDISRERIRQIEKIIIRKVTQFLAGTNGWAVKTLCAQLRTTLGEAVPEAERLPQLQPWLSVFEAPEELALLADFIYWAAGPYKWKNGWGTVDVTLKKSTLRTLSELRDARGWLSPDAAMQALNAVGINASFHSRWVEWLGFFGQDGGWLLRQSSLPDRAEQLLRYHAAPMSVEDILAYVECDSERSLRNRLLDDSRFKRINKQCQFVLSDWPGYEEYSGISDEIAQEIERCGGVAAAQDLIDKLSVRYGVKPGSVAAYLAAPMFVKDEDGTVRLRTPEEAQIVRTNPKLCAGLYEVDGNWVLRVRVTNDTMRGSGRQLPAAVADIAGCQPGTKKVFKSPAGEITVSWPPGSASGPSLGSIRADAEALGAQVDDYMFLTFDRHRIGVRVLAARRLAELSESSKLAFLVGLPVADDLERSLPDVAGAIGYSSLGRAVTREDVHAWLMQRNEVELAKLIPDPENLEGGILSYLEGALGLG